MILGSVALKNPEFVKDVAKKFRIVVGIDAKDGYVATEGWAEISNMKATDLAKEFAKSGVEAIICTDISKDGMLGGVNVNFSTSIADASNIDTIASGGVKDLSDIQTLIETKKIAGVIVGKAYYEGSLDIKEAFKIIS